MANRSGTDVLNFLMNLSRAEEQKKYQKLQKRYVDIAEAQLDITEEVHEAGRPVRQLAGTTASLKEQALKRKQALNVKYAGLRRNADLAKQYGTKEQAKLANVAVDEFKKRMSADPAGLEMILFADENYKNVAGQLNMARQESFALQQMLQATKLMALQKDLQYGEQIKMLQQRTGGFTDPRFLTDTQIGEFDPTSLAQVRQQYYNMGTWPEVRKLWVDTWRWGDAGWKQFTREGAAKADRSEEWESAPAVGRPVAGEPPAAPTTVKAEATKAVKKVEPAGKFGGKDVWVVRPDGKTGTIPESQLEDAKKMGYKVLE